MKKLRIFFLAAWLLGSFFSLHGAEKEIARVKIDEIEWPETREFAIEVKQGDAWKEVARGATIGANKQITFAPVKARFVRLNVLKAERAININEFSVFEK